MKRLDKRRNLCLGIFVLACGFDLSGAGLPADWQREQRFVVSASGLVKLSLPVETLDAARPALEDLRLYDDAGAEIPYWIDRPVPSGSIVRNVKSFQAVLNPAATVLTLDTGLAQPLDGVTLETPAAGFIKSVGVEASFDGKRWMTIAQGMPIFRQANGASQLRVPIATNSWPWLRLTVDDQRSQPVPFTGAQVHAATGESAPGEWQSVVVGERDENPGETRLTLNLGAANLDVASVQIETADPLFTRPVRLAVPQVAADAITEQTLAQGVIYRVAIEGRTAAANLTLPLGAQVRSRELLLFVNNQDSPPLGLTAVRVERRPVYLIFLAQRTGAYHLLTGNPRCAAPRYDLAGLGANLKATTLSAIELSPLTDNAGYHPSEALPGIEVDGSALDIAAWKFRKEIRLARAGGQQLDLDLGVLARAQPGFEDLRVVHGGKQVPYVIEHTSIRRVLKPAVTLTNDSRHPTLSRWILRLPQAGLPVARLTCSTRTALFQREMTLYENAVDERGATYRRSLGQATWIQTPGRAARDFGWSLEGSLPSDTIFLETDNGDNPPVELEAFQAVYPVTRLLFKARPEDGLFLYYGNPRVVPPRYDLSLVASALLAADKAPATLGAEERFGKSSWAEGRLGGQGGYLFWGILALVVVVLLIVISRLLPKSSPPAA